jgi:tetratricopeptide (TPR) repeat protein
MLRFAILALFAALFVSCASNVPKEGAQTPNQTTTTISTTVIVRDTVKVKDSIFIKETESFRAMQKSIDSLMANRETEKAIDLLRKHVQSYSNLDQLGFRTLQLAGMLHQTGRSAEALAFLESFAVYKPAVNFWIDSANTLYDKITKSSKEETIQQIDPQKLETINSLTAQIRNLKLTNSNPALITNLADSLRFMAPGDSILTWLEKQLPSKSESSDSFCEEQRKLAAENFASSRKNKAKAKTLLSEAIEALDKCLARTPSADMRKKVTQNREVISKELRMEN